MSLRRLKEALLDGCSLEAAAAASVLWKKDSKPPDYGPMAEASKEATEIMAGLGYEQLNEARYQYDQAFPIVKEVVDTQLGVMRDTAEQGKDYYNYMKETYRPLEQRLVKEAEQYNSEAEREKRARMAAVDVERQSAIQKNIQARDLARAGVVPGSGKWLALQKQGGLQTAAMRAGAMTKAREDAQALGYAKLLDVAGIGRGLPGASVAAYGASVSAGNSAASNWQAPGQNYINNMATGANTIGNGLNMGLQGQQAILNAQTQYALGEMRNDGGLGAALGGLGNLAYGVSFLSSKKLKTKKKPIDGEVMSKQVEKLPVDQWQYKDGVADEGTHIGPYAEDMAKLGAGDGKTIDLISAMGVNLAATQGLAKRISKIEQKVGA